MRGSTAWKWKVYKLFSRDMGKAVMLEDSWSEGPSEDGREKLEEVIEVTFSPEMEGEISRFGTASLPSVLGV